MNDRQPVHQPGAGVRQVTSHGNMLHNSVDSKQVNMVSDFENVYRYNGKAKIKFS